MSLLESNLHDFAGNAFDLDVHLESGNTVAGACHLEIHIAQMILVPQDISQHLKSVAFLYQAHGNAGYGSLAGHAGIKESQGTAAD